jgi:hypothetical protein
MEVQQLHAVQHALICEGVDDGDDLARPQPKLGLVACLGRVCWLRVRRDRKE